MNFDLQISFNKEPCEKPQQSSHSGPRGRIQCKRGFRQALNILCYFLNGYEPKIKNKKGKIKSLSKILKIQ